MGLSFADVTSLVTKGYKISEINEVKQIVESNESEGKNIIELAKKLGFADFKSAMTLFDNADNAGADQKNSENETDNGKGDNNEDKKETPLEDQQAGEDDVDYKKLYENEKSLRQKLQQNNQSVDASGNEDKRSDMEIALQIASDVLN